ncbi:carbohydrate kinase family protein [Alloacidobacterium dinghuense]|uniref:Carbohydrate kinase family protein n=1 Tax=Alloacidobacterium dinghuense TaxID=2763107 RepID=A0A7G8BMI5_9BACT|nr:carbohydrate kinase family protein [Alloacidobacterium dinghuense]QNI33755.1 carbohydrate kinase family protein [Alloacidobacterium dinghuense]
MSNSQVAQADVSIVGELNADLILYGIPRDLPEEREILASGFTMTLGSSSAILAHNLSAMGTRVSFTSRIGPDALGEMCCRRLHEVGIDLSGVVRSTTGSSTGVTLILPLTDTRRILTYPGAMFEMGIEDVDIDRLASARHFHMSSIFLHRKLTPDIPEIFREMKRRGLSTSLDTNDDPENKWAGVLEEVLTITDLLFCNEEELIKIAGKDDVEAAMAQVAAKVPLLIVKRGSRGACAWRNGKRIDVDGIRVNAVDPVGAGDSFDAGFLHQWVRQAPLESCLAYGNLAGALSVTRSGGTEAFRDAAYREQFLAAHWRDKALIP